MNTIPGDLIESLKTLGLTEYEAKVYSALVLFERSEVKPIYEFLNAPKPSVYQSLKTLMDKGLVQVVNAKPAIYRATPPQIALKHMMDVHRKAEENALLELEELEKSRVKQETTDAIWTVYGDRNIDYGIEELLVKAKKSLKILMPQDRLRYLELLRGKSVAVELLVFSDDAMIPERYGLKSAVVHNAMEIDLADFTPILKYFSQVPLKGDQATRFLFIMADGREFMYVPPLPGTMSGLATSNSFVISLGTIVFGAIWEHTPAIYPVKK
ncbi:MAG TPA: helix-turn-helix domain-containing protein [Methanocella sp.]|uniref:TrmB family transcriptional regulator n=1 Tax=Methanocella sp. TaxID=2052833 RepID=UPI002B8D4BEB|nr:helix-turn-helix domain-containing protein [Methanocella sp.]HTY91836.1 helix-turn-helix domain-containing protein [Methanocella sp.]